MLAKQKCGKDVLAKIKSKEGTKMENIKIKGLILKIGEKEVLNVRFRG